MEWKEDRKFLEYLISLDWSYNKMAKLFGCSATHVVKICKKLGIELKPRRKINPKETFNRGTGKKTICQNCGKEFKLYSSTTGKFCCTECHQEFRHKEKYQKLIEGDESIMRANYSPKNFKKDILEEQNGKCAICGCEQIHNGKPLVFILDHIDGHASNNRRDNLRCICPNCDSQLDTFKSKNKNGDRYYYRYKKEKK